MKTNDFKWTVYRDYVKINSVIESCVNTVQLDSVDCWACNLVDKWQNYSNSLPLVQAIEFDRLTNDVCLVITRNINKKRQELEDKLKKA